MRIKIIGILIVYLFDSGLFCWGETEVTGFLDNNLVKTRVIWEKDDYSACFIIRDKIQDSGILFDFSFDSPIVRAGRLKKRGVWSELASPLTSSAWSDIFRESPVLEKNYDTSGSSLYGVSFGMDGLSGVNILFTDYFWMGGNISTELDFIHLGYFASITEKIKTRKDEWFSDYAFIPESNPVHLGMEVSFFSNNFKGSYLLFFSGNTLYKAGFFNRIYFELTGKILKLKVYGGFVSPCFIDSSVNFPGNRYLVSLWGGFYPLDIIHFEIKSKYEQTKFSSVSGTYLPYNGEIIFSGLLKNNFFLISTALGQKFSFLESGERDVENSFKVKTGISGAVSFGFNFEALFDFDRLTARKFETEIKGIILKTDFSFIYSFKETSENAIEQSIKTIIDQKIRHGSLLLIIEIDDSWNLNTLSTGFKVSF